MPTKPVRLLSAAFATAATITLIASCSSSSTGSGGATSGAGSTPPASSSAGTSSSTAAPSAVSIRVTGNRLTAPDGHTLYYNTVDTAKKIDCVGTCASLWLPVTGTPKAGSGVAAAALATTPRPDGSTQVTYRGHPLYEFSGDSTAGDHKGDGITDGGGKWLVAASGVGASASTAPSTAASSSASAGGGGYQYP